MGSNPNVFRINFCLFQIEETCTFMNISSLNYHLSMIQTKAENSSTLCKFHKGRKTLRPMESNADRLSLYSFSLYSKMALLNLKIVFNGKELQTGFSI